MTKIIYMTPEDFYEKYKSLEFKFERYYGQSGLFVFKSNLEDGFQVSLDVFQDLQDWPKIFRVDSSKVYDIYHLNPVRGWSILNRKEHESFDKEYDRTSDDEELDD